MSKIDISGLYKKSLLATSIGVILPAVVATSDATAAAEQPKKWAPKLQLEAKVGNKRHLGRFGALVPLVQSLDGMFFTDLRFMADSKKDREGNFGLGYRWLDTSNEAIYGAYAYYDRRKSGNFDVMYNQATVGFERLSNLWDARINFYLPQSKATTKTNVEKIYNYQPGLQQFQQTNVSGETALRGLDLEAGIAIPGVQGLRVYGGTYHYAGREGAKAVHGFSGRVNYKMNEHVAFETSVFSDNVRKTNAYVGVNLSITLGDKEKSSNLSEIEKRMTDMPVRDVDIVTGAYNKKSDIVVADPKGTYAHVNGDVKAAVLKLLTTKVDDKIKAQDAVEAKDVSGKAVQWKAGEEANKFDVNSAQFMNFIEAVLLSGDKASNVYFVVDGTEVSAKNILDEVRAQVKASKAPEMKKAKQMLADMDAYVAVNALDASAKDYNAAVTAKKEAIAKAYGVEAVDTTAPYDKEDKEIRSATEALAIFDTSAEELNIQKTSTFVQSQRLGQLWQDGLADKENIDEALDIVREKSDSFKTALSEKILEDVTCGDADQIAALKALLKDKTVDQISRSVKALAALYAPVKGIEGKDIDVKAVTQMSELKEELAFISEALKVIEGEAVQKQFDEDIKQKLDTHVFAKEIDIDADLLKHAKEKLKLEGIDSEKIKLSDVQKLITALSNDTSVKAAAEAAKTAHEKATQELSAEDKKLAEIQRKLNEANTNLGRVKDQKIGENLTGTGITSALRSLGITNENAKDVAAAQALLDAKVAKITAQVATLTAQKEAFEASKKAAEEKVTALEVDKTAADTLVSNHAKWVDDIKTKAGTAVGSVKETVIGGVGSVNDQLGTKLLNRWVVTGHDRVFNQANDIINAKIQDEKTLRDKQAVLAQYRADFDFGSDIDLDDAVKKMVETFKKKDATLEELKKNAANKAKLLGIIGKDQSIAKLRGYTNSVTLTEIATRHATQLKTVIEADKGVAALYDAAKIQKAEGFNLADEIINAVKKAPLPDEAFEPFETLHTAVNGFEKNSSLSPLKLKNEGGEEITAAPLELVARVLGLDTIDTKETAGRFDAIENIKSFLAKEDIFLKQQAELAKEIFHVKYADDSSTLDLSKDKTVLDKTAHDLFFKEADQQLSQQLFAEKDPTVKGLAELSVRVQHVNVTSDDQRYLDAMNKYIAAEKAKLTPEKIEAVDKVVTNAMNYANTALIAAEFAAFDAATSKDSGVVEKLKNQFEKAGLTAATIKLMTENSVSKILNSSSPTSEQRKALVQVLSDKGFALKFHGTEQQNLIANHVFNGANMMSPNGSISSEYVIIKGGVSEAKVKEYFAALVNPGEYIDARLAVEVKQFAESKKGVATSNKLTTTETPVYDVFAKVAKTDYVKDKLLTELKKAAETFKVTGVDFEDGSIGDLQKTFENHAAHVKTQKESVDKLNNGLQVLKDMKKVQKSGELVDAIQAYAIAQDIASEGGSLTVTTAAPAVAAVSEYVKEFQKDAETLAVKLGELKKAYDAAVTEKSGRKIIDAQNAYAAAMGELNKLSISTSTSTSTSSSSSLSTEADFLKELSGNIFEEEKELEAIQRDMEEKAIKAKSVEKQLQAVESLRAVVDAVKALEPKTLGAFDENKRQLVVDGLKEAETVKELEDILGDISDSADKKDAVLSKIDTKARAEGFFDAFIEKYDEGAKEAGYSGQLSNTELKDGVNNAEGPIFVKIRKALLEDLLKQGQSFSAEQKTLDDRTALSAPIQHFADAYIIRATLLVPIDDSGELYATIGNADLGIQHAISVLDEISQLEELGLKILDGKLAGKDVSTWETSFSDLISKTDLEALMSSLTEGCYFELLNEVLPPKA